MILSMFADIASPNLCAAGRLFRFFCFANEENDLFLRGDEDQDPLLFVVVRQIEEVENRRRSLKRDGGSGVEHPHSVRDSLHQPRPTIFELFLGDDQLGFVLEEKKKKPELDDHFSSDMIASISFTSRGASAEIRSNPLWVITYVSSMRIPYSFSGS